jgi:hypothetical protein
MSKLTPEDIAWLEGQLTHLAGPVAPRPDFVDRAREQLMHLEVHRPRHARQTALVMIVCSIVGLVAAILLLRRDLPRR